MFGLCCCVVCVLQKKIHVMPNVYWQIDKKPKIEQKDDDSAVLVHCIYTSTCSCCSAEV